MSPITSESNNEMSNSFFENIKNKYDKNHEHIDEGSSLLVSIGLLFPLIPLMFFVLFYYVLFYIDIFTR